MTLWGSYVYGPVRSRRLGSSLGLNLLPAAGKLCNYDCPYCECGWTPRGGGRGRLPSMEELCAELRARLVDLQAARTLPDALTMAGNGEPTLHPRFPQMVDAVRAIRDELAPRARLVVLSNGTRVARPEVFEALLRADERQLKLDAGTERTFRLLNAPLARFTLEDLVACLKRFEGDLVIQTLLTRGTVHGEPVDNTAAEEVGALVERLREIRPKRVALYSLDRPAPEPGLLILPPGDLERVAATLRREGFPVDVHASPGDPSRRRR
jgi:wyosine [tRNA(Phe)-imidazoG37] synthetase (radical SAM superfamily)